MEKILGIDLGTNSIGWAIRDSSIKGNQIIDKGVLTFEKGVNEGKSGEFPMVQKRTESRHKRRNYQAEKYRKWALLESLIENNMCPLSTVELDKWRKYEKGTGRKYPQSEKFIQWLRFDFNGDGKPDFEQFGYDKHESYYLFRVLAISEKESDKNIFRGNPEILGRIFYQLVQRRGFKGRDEEEAKTMLEGSEKLGVDGRNNISPLIETYKTLGSALYHLQKEKKGARIRKRYNLRTDYEAELKEICRVQAINDDIYKKLWKAIVWQRPLRSQKGLVGICTFEKNKSRCPVSHYLYEEFRTWVLINNLKIRLPENINRTTYLKEKIYPLFYKGNSDFKLDTILKQLYKVGGDIDSKDKPDKKILSCKLINSFENLFGEDWRDLNIETQKTRKEFKKDGTAIEHKIRYTIEDVWHVLSTFDDSIKLKEFASKKLKLNETDAEKFSKIKLQQGYATLSLSAINKILPFLYKGFIYSEAIYLANMPKVFGEKNLNQDLINNFESIYQNIRIEHDNEKTLNSVVNDLIRIELNEDNNNRYTIEDNRELDSEEKKLIEERLIDVIGINSWNAESEEYRKNAINYVSKYFKEFLQKPINAKKDTLFLKIPNLHEKISTHLNESYGINKTQIDKYLWHPSEQESYNKIIPKTLEDGRVLKFLQDPQPISRGFKNPMALKTLHKLKNLINYLLEAEKIDEDTRVVVEIARELNDSNKRKAIEKWQRDRERENDEFKKIVDEINIDCKTNYDRDNKTLLEKIRLWKEQNMRCMYTGQTIKMCDLFNGSKYDFEHTIPASMSFDNEMKNLTISDSRYNREVKGKNIPFDCPNYEGESQTYLPILLNIEQLFGKITIEEKITKGKKVRQVSSFKTDQLINNIESWVNQTKIASTKERKDYCIQQRHLYRFELDYWRKKLETFTCTEYKAGWRNSQLRDTQVITKFALPYLKTVFKRIEVQKGSVTADFREIFEIQPKLEKKSRDTHAHHAIDAAVLTLIPPSFTRDKILLAYNEAKDNKTGKVYHEKPNGWKEFNASDIIAIEKDVLINFQPQYRTLTDTKKNIRKRGKQQFVKYNSNGKWYFKLDIEGKKIPLIANGDSIRGQLHKESFFGAIKLNGELTLAERYPISSFTSINDCKNIIDKKVREIVKETIEMRIANGQTFDKAKLDPIPFPSGKAIIKKVRCKVAAGRGFLSPEKALEIHKHDFLSKHDYKQYVYAQNEENTLCLYYEHRKENSIDRAFRIVGLFELSKLKLKNISDIKDETYYKTIEIGKGKNTKEIPISNILKVGTKVIFYKESLEELKDLEKYNLLKRLFRIYKFNEMGTPNMFLQNHLEARKNDLLDDGDTLFDPSKNQYRLKLKADKFTCAIEGKHFEIKPDGEIIWKF